VTIRVLQIYLTVTSLMAVAAVMEPTLVVVGFYLGILPGVLLQLAPAGVIYGVVFALVMQLAMPMSFRPAVRAVGAFATTLAVFWAIPQPGLWYAQSLLNNSYRPDIAPPKDAPVQLSGHVLIANQNGSSRCAALCAALLNTPGVTAVTVQSTLSDHRTFADTFRFVPATVPGDPVTPTAFGFEDPAVEREWLAERRALEAGWLLRLTTGVKLVANKAQPGLPADFTFELHKGTLLPEKIWSRWSLLPSPGELTTATIRDRESRVLLRRQKGTISAPSAPLVSVYTGAVEAGHVGWSLRTFSCPAASGDVLSLDRLALVHTNVARGAADFGAVMRKARLELVAALADPARPVGDPGLRLANVWMQSFRRSATPMRAEDVALVERIVLDGRITDVQGRKDALNAMSPSDAERIRRHMPPSGR
jgi:hypothetical protein